MSEHTVNVTDSSFKAEVLESSVPVVVDFWATWCGPCRMIAPALDEIAAEMAGKIKIAKVDIDSNPQLASQFRVMSVPMLMVFKGGQIKAQKTGAAPKGELSRWISGAMA